MQSPMVCRHFRSRPSAVKHVEYVPLPPLVPQNATSPPTALKEIAKSYPSNVCLQTNALYPPPQSPQPISPSHFSGDHPHHNKKYLELLGSSLATVSGNTLEEVLTPRAYDTFRALYALAALDAATSKSGGSEIPNRSTFPDIGNDCPHSSIHSPPVLNSSLAVPRTGRIHISISVDNVIFFLWAGLAVVSFLLVFFNFPRLCERDGTGHF